MNIVTIDFDIIMGPSIGVYNNAVNEDFKVDSIIEDYPFLSNVPADLNIYEYLTRYIVDVIKVLPQDKIQFIRSHEQIVPLVSKYRNANLVNIDHHHDIGYEIEDWAKPIVGKPQCGNWVKKLFDTKVINHYDWVSNPLSDVLHHAQRLPILRLSGIAGRGGDAVSPAPHRLGPAHPRRGRESRRRGHPGHQCLPPANACGASGRRFCRHGRRCHVPQLRQCVCQ